MAVPTPLPDKDGVVVVRKKDRECLRQQKQSAAVHQQKIELNKEGRSDGTIMSRRRCTDNPVEMKVLYLSID